MKNFILGIIVTLIIAAVVLAVVGIKMISDYLIGYCLNGYVKKKGKIFFIPRCFNCGKNCTETTIRRFVSYATMTYSDICADCYCKINVEQKKKDRYKNWLRGEQVFITSREVKK